jgi:hypothetical protein
MNFWKNVSSFRKNVKNLIELEINGNRLTQPREDADAFAAHLKCLQQPLHAGLLVLFGRVIPYLQLLSLTEMFTRSSESVRLDGISAFIIKGCLDVLLPVLKLIFNLNLSLYIFLTLASSKLPLFPFFKNGKTVVVNNYRHIHSEYIFQNI